MILFSSASASLSRQHRNQPAGFSWHLTASHQDAGGRSWPGAVPFLVPEARVSAIPEVNQKDDDSAGTAFVKKSLAAPYNPRVCSCWHQTWVHEASAASVAGSDAQRAASR